MSFLFIVKRSLPLVFLFWVGFSLAQDSSHPETSGGRSYMALEGPMMSAPTTAESEETLLGRRFPRLHGNEAVHLDYVYTGGVFNNSKGGIQTRRGSSYIGIANISLTADTEMMGLWKNGTFFVNSLFSHGPSPSRFVGDVQGVGVFAYETPAQVSEYWYEHRFFRNRLTVKGGKVDAGTDFFYLDSTADFMNSSYTCIPNTRVPTAPSNAWGVAGLWNITDNLHFKAGIFDGEGNADKFWMSDSSKFYAAYQIEYHYSLCCGLPGFAYFGGWHDDCSYEMLYDDTVTRTGNHGFSVGLEQCVYRKNVCDKSNLRGLYAFANYGKAKEDRTELDTYWGTGLVWRGIGHRQDDSLGMAVNHAYFSKHLETKYAYESAFEIYYKYQWTSFCSIQPDIQYIAHPSGEERDSITTGLIFQVVF